jgi:hypothetical protein
LADSKISALTDGTSPQSTDAFVVARGTGNNKLTWAELLASLTTASSFYVSGMHLGLPNDTNGFSATGMTQSALVASPIYIYGFSAVSFASISVSVTTLAAASTIRLGFYKADGTNGGPGTNLYDLGTIDSSTTGIKTITSTFSLGPGLVWVAACAQGGAPSVRSYGGPTSMFMAPNTSPLSNGSQASNVVASAACTGALPASFSTYSLNTSLNSTQAFPKVDLVVT